MPKTKLRLNRGHQNKTGYIGVFKAWWPGDTRKPKNADMNGFKVILKHPHLKRAINVRTFNVAKDAAQVIAAWGHLTQGRISLGRAVQGKKHTDILKHVFFKALDEQIYVEEQAAVIDEQEITNLEESKSLLHSNATISASLLLTVAVKLYSFE